MGNMASWYTIYDLSDVKSEISKNLEQTKIWYSASSSKPHNFKEKVLMRAANLALSRDELLVSIDQCKLTFG